MSISSIMDPVDTELALWLLLMRTSRAISKARERELLGDGITAPGFAILLTIMRQGANATPATIARETILEPNSVSQQLTRMERDNLVERVRDLERKNQVRIQITRKGYQAYAKASKRPLTKKIMSVLTADEKQLLWGVLAKLRRKTLKELRASTSSLFPPDDPADLCTD